MFFCLLLALALYIFLYVISGEMCGCWKGYFTITVETVHFQYISIKWRTDASSTPGFLGKLRPSSPIFSVSILSSWTRIHHGDHHRLPFTCKDTWRRPSSRVLWSTKWNSVVSSWRLGRWTAARPRERGQTCRNVQLKPVQSMLHTVELPWHVPPGDTW